MKIGGWRLPLFVAGVATMALGLVVIMAGLPADPSVLLP